ncbi:MAG: hypothetical protein L0387_46135 [Acidobacteria bacterium]|nr:hypothetical protein [Acidobacteriota bacterium]MCI0721730.1 hypothetical protein [Acidobacteriota bacterium]
MHQKQYPSIVLPIMNLVGKTLAILMTLVFGSASVRLDLLAANFASSRPDTCQMHGGKCRCVRACQLSKPAAKAPACHSPSHHPAEVSVDEANQPASAADEHKKQASDSFSKCVVKAGCSSQTSPASPFPGLRDFLPELASVLNERAIATFQTDWGRYTLALGYSSAPFHPPRSL